MTQNLSERVNKAVEIMKLVPGQKVFRTGLWAGGAGAVGLIGASALESTAVGAALIPGTMWTVGGLLAGASKVALVVGGACVLKGFYDVIRWGGGPGPIASQLEAIRKKTQEMNEERQQLAEERSRVEALLQQLAAVTATK